MKIEKWLIVPDAQIRKGGLGVDQKTNRAIQSFARKYRWDGWLQGGDLIDFDMIGKFVEGMPAIVTAAGTIQEAYNAGNEFLDGWEKTLRPMSPRCRRVVLQGNHDFRIEYYLKKHPELAGDILSVERNLRFRERKIEYVLCWSKGHKFRLGKAQFTHSGPSMTENHAKAACEAFRRPTYYFHVEDLQTHTLSNMEPDQDIIECGSSGCISEWDLGWNVEGKPKKRRWQQSFSVFYVVKETGYFQRIPIRIFKHKFIGPDGVLYSGR